MRNIVVLTAVFVVLAFSAIFLAGSIYFATNLASSGSPPDDLGAEAVSISTHEGGLISGWYAGDATDRGCILLLHSLRSNRLEMTGRARFLRDAGYSVLMIDMYGHGETGGANVTFGYLESFSVHSSIAYLRSRFPGVPIGVIGISLGGAAALLGDAPVKVEALVLESVYTSIDAAVENRLELHLGPLARYLSPLLLWQFEPRLGVPVDWLVPVEAIATLTSPVMVISGSADRHTLLSETLELFSRAQEPKQLWILEGAEHQDLHRYSPAVYEARVLAFFREHLGKF